ncbi:TolC family protein [Flavobacterium sp. '19STA2R22 D10 B1']|uniref:TolC family protein n=1 Tax=Flavobacterium aerium TaxID=3037261 RepID=UPI00278C2D04|nr:TolC family protein [Flavobacterium sp. '19STA2R22 D10 B1']
MNKTFVLKSVFVLMALASFTSYGQQKKWTLQECVNYAIEHNISVKQSALDNQLAAIDKKGAIGNFLPSVNMSASHSWNIGLNQNITTGLLQNQTTQFTSAGASVGIDIYKGLQNVNTLNKARLSVIAGQYKLLKMQEDVALNVANAFLQILFNKENLKVQNEQLASNNRQLERTTELVNAGVVPRGDLLDIKATVAGDMQRVINAENVLLISKLSLAQLLQLEDFEKFDVADDKYDAVASATILEEPSAIYAKAKEQRTELKVAKANLEIAEKDVAIAKGAYQPTIRGFYDFNTRAAYADQVVGAVPNTENPTTTIGYVQGMPNQMVVRDNFTSVLGKPDAIFDQFDRNKGQTFGLSLNVPIFNGFSARNNVARSKVALDRSKIAYAQQELDLERNVYTAFTDVKGSMKAYDAAISALEAREEALRYAKERYDVGMMNAFDFNQAQTLYVNAQSEVLRTKYDYIFRVKILDFYFGIPIIQKN